MNCPCLFISQLAFSVIVFDDHDACGKCGLEVGVGGFLFFISEGIFSIVGVWLYAPPQVSLLVQVLFASDDSFLSIYLLNFDSEGRYLICFHLFLFSFCLNWDKKQSPHYKEAGDPYLTCLSHAVCLIITWWLWNGTVVVLWLHITALGSLFNGIIFSQKQIPRLLPQPHSC